MKTALIIALAVGVALIFAVAVRNIPNELVPAEIIQSERKVQSFLLGCRMYASKQASKGRPARFPENLYKLKETGITDEDLQNLYKNIQVRYFPPPLNAPGDQIVIVAFTRNYIYYGDVNGNVSRDKIK